MRTTREKTGTGQRHVDDGRVFWLGLGAMPLAYAVVVAAAGTMKRVRRTRSERAVSPEAELRARIQAAEEASTMGSPHHLDAATARAIEAATIAGCKLNVRGLTTSAVARALRDAGADDGDATEIESILRACDAARFSAGSSADDGAANEARERWERARRAIDRLTGLAWRT
jgi:hypothetical protein